MRCLINFHRLNLLSLTLTLILSGFPHTKSLRLLQFYFKNFFFSAQRGGPWTPWTPPWIRHWFGFVFVLDAITVASLWIAGGPSWRVASSASLEASISHYSFYYSPVLLLKLILSLLLLSRTESASLRALESPYVPPIEPHLRRSPQHSQFDRLWLRRRQRRRRSRRRRRARVRRDAAAHVRHRDRDERRFFARRSRSLPDGGKSMRSINVDDDDVDGTDDEKNKKRRKVDSKRLVGLVAPVRIFFVIDFFFFRKRISF